MSARLALLVALLALACAGTQAGRPVHEASDDGRSRLEGVELGSVGSPASLSQGAPWVPLIALCRKTLDERDEGSFFLARVVLAGETFGFEHLVATGPAGEKIFPGRVVHAESRFGVGDRRFTEEFEAPLSDADVAWLAAAGDALELRMEGTRLWIRVPPGAALVRAVQSYREQHADGAP